MTDRELVHKARQIEQARFRLWDLCRELNRRGTDDPQVRAFGEALEHNDIPPLAWATHVVHSCLAHPERWETGDWGIRHKAASKAVHRRKAAKAAEGAG